MRDDNSNVAITSEDDETLVIQTPEGKHETYYLNPIRTMELQVAELQICYRAHSYSLSPETDIMPDLKPCGNCMVTGRVDLSDRRAIQRHQKFSDHDKGTRRGRPSETRRR